MRLPRVLVLGGGELGSAVSHRLVRAGFQVFVADLAMPTCIRRSVSFATALMDGSARVEGIGAVRAASVAEALAIARVGLIAVVTVGVGEGARAAGAMRKTRAGVGKDAVAGERRQIARLARALGARVVVDARMLKRAGVISRRSAPLVVGLGPGLRAPKDAHAIIETNRGHNLGRVILKGTAEPDTGKPGEIGGRRAERVIRAPASGAFRAEVALGSMVRKDETLGKILPGEAMVRATISGLLRGLIADGIPVKRGQKIGDVDPRGRAVDPLTISDKARAVAGGVLEAIMNWWAGPDARP